MTACCPTRRTRAYGTPDELKTLIDAAHGLGMSVFLDVVYNHFGPDGAYLHAFAKKFFRDDLKTPWGAAIDFRRPEVRDYFIQNARLLAARIPLRRPALRRGARHLGRGLPDRPRPHRSAAASSPAGTSAWCWSTRATASRLLGGPPRFDAQWADDFHHCMHVLLTGEHEGYYEDFQDADRPAGQVPRRGLRLPGRGVRRTAASRAASPARTCRRPPSSSACRTTTRSATAPWASG